MLEKALESPLDCKEIKPVSPEGSQPWIFIGRADAEAEALILKTSWCKELTHWKRPWCRGRSRAEGKGGNRGWDGWMASLTQRTWIWANSGRQWRTGKPDVLQSVRSQRVGHDLETEQQQLLCYGSLSRLMWFYTLFLVIHSPLFPASSLHFLTSTPAKSSTLCSVLWGFNTQQLCK